MDFDIGDFVLVATENGKITITFEKKEDQIFTFNQKAQQLSK